MGEHALTAESPLAVPPFWKRNPPTIQMRIGCSVASGGCALLVGGLAAVRLRP